MSLSIGRTKSGGMIRACKVAGGGLMLEVEDEPIEEYESREEARREGKRIMLKDWLPGAEPENIKALLSGHIKINYDFMAEWREDAK